MKVPKDYLVDCLKKRGIKSIKSKEKNINKLAIKLARKKLKFSLRDITGTLSETYKGIDFLLGAGDKKTTAYAGKYGETLALGIELEYPKIVIDFSLWDFLSFREKWLLKKQVGLTIQIMREHLWDRNLVLSSCPNEVSEFVKQWDFFGDILKGKFTEDALVLDPRADEEIKKFSEKGTYIIGGIVDRSNRLRTQELGYNLKKAAIKFEGKASNVPDRINILSEFICRNLEGEPLKRLIQQSHF